MPERDLVDESIRAAKEALNAQVLTGRDAAMGAIFVHCTEAIVRQIRDADDTIATVLTPQIEAAIEDLTVVIGAIEIPEPQRKGIFRD